MAWFQGLSKDLTEGLAEFGADLGQIGKVRDARQLEKLLFDDDDASRPEEDQKRAQQQQQQQQGSSNPGPAASSSAAAPEARPRPLPFGKELRSNAQSDGRADAHTSRFSSRAGGSSVGHKGIDPNGAAASLPPGAAGERTPLRPTPKNTRLTPRSSPTVQPSAASKSVPPTSIPASRVTAVHSSITQPQHYASTPAAPAPAAAPQLPPQANLAPSPPSHSEHEQQQQPPPQQQQQQQQASRPQESRQQSTPLPASLTPNVRPAQHTNSIPSMLSSAPASSYPIQPSRLHLANAQPSTTTTTSTTTSNASSAHAGSSAPREDLDSNITQEFGGQDAQQEQREGVKVSGEQAPAGRDGARGGGGSEDGDHPRSQEVSAPDCVLTFLSDHHHRHRHHHCY